MNRKDAVPVLVVVTVFITTFIDQLFVNKEAEKALSIGSWNLLEFSSWLVNGTLLLIIVAKLFRMDSLYLKLRPVILTFLCLKWLCFIWLGVRAI